MSPGGSGYFTCIQNMKLVTNKFKSGGLHEKHVVATYNHGEWWGYRNMEIIFYLTMFVNSMVYFSKRRGIRSMEVVVRKFVDLNNKIIIIIIITYQETMKSRNYRKQPYWALHTYFGKY